MQRLPAFLTAVVLRDTPGLIPSAITPLTRAMHELSARTPDSCPRPVGVGENPLAAQTLAAQTRYTRETKVRWIAVDALFTFIQGLLCEEQGQGKYA